jgi:hypothetical protein
MNKTLIGCILLILSTPLLLLAIARFDLFQRYFGWLGYWRFPNVLKFSYAYFPASKYSCILGVSMCITLGLLALPQFTNDIVKRFFLAQILLAIPMGINDYRMSRRKSTEANKTLVATSDKVSH